MNNMIGVEGLTVSNFVMSGYTKDLPFKVEHYIDGKLVPENMYLFKLTSAPECIESKTIVRAKDSNYGCFYFYQIDTNALGVLSGKHILTEKIIPLPSNNQDKDIFIQDNITTLEVDFSSKYYNKDRSGISLYWSFKYCRELDA